MTVYSSWGSWGFFSQRGVEWVPGWFSFATADPGWALLDEYTINNVYIELKHQINLTNSSKLNKIK